MITTIRDVLADLSAHARSGRAMSAHDCGLVGLKLSALLNGAETLDALVEEGQARERALAQAEDQGDVIVLPCGVHPPRFRRV
jgi:hypothetical protein